MPEAFASAAAGRGVQATDVGYEREGKGPDKKDVGRLFPLLGVHSLTVAPASSRLFTYADLRVLISDRRA